MCIEAPEAACIDATGTWQGMGSDCATTICPAACVTDITGDNTTNIDDLIDLLFNWGTCP